MAMAKGILLDENNDLKIANGDLVIGDTLMQEVGIILQMNQGEFKFDPLLGANLVVNMRGIKNKSKIESLIDTQLTLDGKDYDEIKELIKQKFT
jgi:hypothetical protein